MDSTDLKVLTQKVILASKEAGSFLKQEISKLKSKDVEEKGLHDLVTYVDKTAERMLVYSLNDILPEAGFIAEEGTNNKVGEDYNWIIDPLDGTTNYIHGVPLYSVSLALKFRNEIILGVIYEPNLNECFYSWKGGGSYLNGKIIKVSETLTIDKALFATGFPYYDYSLMKEYMSFFEYLMRNSRGIRRLGTAAMDLAYVACGRYDGFYEYGLKPWDVAAGSIIVRNAGGVNMDFSGGKDFVFGKEILSVNSNIADPFLKQIKHHFNK
ncbi:MULTISPECIES: inositol monophosphatase family protein [unclassified Lentimicrobium]|uniref:inositol monophosphatase family protein n=1 Tax=unclassified Lentimicrobium TaxID=2677434 RepID=UPI001557BD4B|nr:MULTISPECIES: inositol monophosphatase family protein [unclassified Lentimicrobium]NPD45061.1 inositol monophosphatase [Lentimicrobium sp. S6]NPD84541.1 inositol monophosphatase [Lentimicrobium sp. L6]